MLELGNFNSPLALIRFIPTLIATFRPKGSYLFLKSLYFWFASATSGVKNKNFLPFNAFGIPASSPTNVFPLPVAETTNRFSPFNNPSLIAKYWTGRR